MWYRLYASTWKIETPHHAQKKISRVKIPKCIDVSQLEDSKVRDNIQRAFAHVEFDGTWEKKLGTECILNISVYLTVYP